MSALTSFVYGAGLAAFVAAAPAFAASVPPSHSSVIGAGTSIDFFANDAKNEGIFVDADDDFSFTFIAQEATNVYGLKVNGIGLFENLGLFEIEFSSNFGMPTETVSYDITGDPGSTAVGEFLFDDQFAVSAGDSFTIEFITTSAQVAPFTLAGVTFVASVPVPAALPLLLTALGGTVALRRRQSAA